MRIVKELIKQVTTWNVLMTLPFESEQSAIQRLQQNKAH